MSWMQIVLSVLLVLLPLLALSLVVGRIMGETKAALVGTLLAYAFLVAGKIIVGETIYPAMLFAVLMGLLLACAFFVRQTERLSGIFWILTACMLMLLVAMSGLAIGTKSPIMMFLVLIAVLLTAISLHSAWRPIASIIPLKDMFPDPRLRKLAKAASQGKLRTIDRLVEQGVDVNGRGFKGITPLCWSVGDSEDWPVPDTPETKILGFNGNIKGFRRLLELGADPNTVAEGNDLAYTGTMYAVLCKVSPDWLRLALEHGGNPNLDFGIIWAPAPLFRALGSEERDKRRLLLDGGADINIRNGSGSTPLMIAAYDQEFDVVVELLEQGADYRLKDYSGNTLIDEVIYQLSDYITPADPDEAKKVFDWLANRGVEIPTWPPESETPGRPNVLWMTLEELFSDPQLRSLGRAVRRGQISEIERLLAQGVDVNATGSCNATVLALAFINIDAFKRLLELGANPNAQYETSGRSTSIMHEIILDRHLEDEFLKLALEHGGDPNLLVGADRESSLFKAMRPLPLHENIKSKAFILLDAGADMNIQAASGETPMMLAAHLYQYELVHEQLERGADYNIRAKDGKTLLDHIAYNRRFMAPTLEIDQWREKVINWLKVRGVEIPEWKDTSDIQPKNRG